MVEAADRFWADHQFEAAGQKMGEEAALLRTAIQGIQPKQEQIKKPNDQLNDRLKTVKTRFERIGHEVSQAGLIFPMILEVVLLVASSNLCGSIRDIFRNRFSLEGDSNSESHTQLKTPET
jgi:hypothetical protein